MTRLAAQYPPYRLTASMLLPFRSGRASKISASPALASLAEISTVFRTLHNLIKRAYTTCCAD